MISILRGELSGKVEESDYRQILFALFQVESITDLNTKQADDFITYLKSLKVELSTNFGVKMPF